MLNKRVIVIGAGAAGMMAAGRAAQSGVKVLLLEKMEQPGKKILISGKTRCNLSNSRELEDFIAAFGNNGKFLYGAFHRFFRGDLLAFLLHYGVETRTERGGRIFPASRDACDIVKAFERYLADGAVELRTGLRVKQIQVDRQTINGVELEAGVFPASAVILATGGACYPATGSTGDGYLMAEAVGHTIVKLRPSLVPLVVEEIDLVKSMQDVNLRNVRLTAYGCRAEEIEPPEARRTGSGHSCPVIDSRMGEILLTHFGIAGPITLQMSLSIVEALEKGPVGISIDLKPALDIKHLQRRLQRDFDTFGKRDFRQLLGGLLPAIMIDPFIKLSEISPGKPGHQIDSNERDRLARLLKSLRFNIKSALPMSSAMVTAGGVSLKEIEPRTMASKILKGLYFCGEVIDVNADTGGYNLQAAFSTGFVAGESAARYIQSL